MRRGWLRSVYRALAVVVLCSLTAFQLESLIADICDGDATPAQLAAFGGSASDLPPNATEVAAARVGLAAVPAAAGAALAERVGTTDALTRAPGADTELPVPAPLPTHSAHACHCVHAHSGVLPRLETVEITTVAVSRAVPSARDFAPPSVSREPRLRPPLT